MKNPLSRQTPQNKKQEPSFESEVIRLLNRQDRKLDKIMANQNELLQELKDLRAQLDDIKSNLDEAKTELLAKIAALEKKIEEGAVKEELLTELAGLRECATAIGATSGELKDHVPGSPGTN